MALTPKRSKTSRFVGVCWGKKTRRWIAYLRDPAGKWRHISEFPTEETAAVAHDRVALHLFGRSATRNFPRRDLRPATITEIRADGLRQRKARCTSRYVGVVFYPRDAPLRPWEARLDGVRRGASLALGHWRTEALAALAHDRAALFYFGSDAKLNLAKRRSTIIPSDSETLVWESRQVFKAQTTSRFHGVSWKRNQNCWCARIKVADLQITIGLFDDEEEAAHAYDRRALKAFGTRAKLNFHPVTGEALFGKRVGSRGEPGAARERPAR